MLLTFFEIAIFVQKKNYLKQLDDSSLLKTVAFEWLHHFHKVKPIMLSRNWFEDKKSTKEGGRVRGTKEQP